MNTRFDDPSYQELDLINYVIHSNITGDEKVKFLSQINHQKAYDYIRLLVNRNPQYQRNLIFELSSNPNTLFESFILEMNQQNNQTHNEIYLSSSLFRALIKCNTPKTRKAILEKWSDKIDIINMIIISELSRLDWGDPVLPNWTSMLASAQDYELREMAVEAWPGLILPNRGRCSINGRKM